jgi:uncharacterized membrane protein
MAAASIRGPRTHWPALVWGASTLFAVVLSCLGVWRYRIIRSGVDDGIFAQVISSAFRGFHSTVEGNVNHLAVHFSPILFLVAPLLSLTHSTLALVVLQAILLGLVAPPLFLIARRRMPEALAAGAALVVLLYPPLIAVAFGDFHELAFAPAATAWLLWAVDGRRWPLAWIFAACALAVKEDQLIVLAFLGCSLALAAARGKDAPARTFSLSLAGAALGTLAVYFLLLRPAVAGGVAYWSLRFYDWHSSFVSPLGTAPLDSPVRWQYALGALAPLAGVCMLSPAMLLVLPGMAEAMLSHEAITLNLGTHYVANWLPYILLAFVLGIARLARRNARLGVAAVALALCASLAFDVFASPAGWWYYLYRQPNAHDATLDRFIAELPAGANVAASIEVFSHLGFLPNAAIGLDGSRFILIDRRCDTAYCRGRFFPESQRLIAAGAYRLSRAEDGIELYEERPGMGASLRARRPRADAGVRTGRPLFGDSGRGRQGRRGGRL